ncbi:hypothetical protein EGT74_07745 [Chitinophaga lutea]|uniref:Uncharacterized protein n=1 Tax=Chitinophaga lutea TaxID=2488634 RepID=A0A3N4QBR0_9BACT|nr:hypothetical protein [Chitinophaga lutea]RPE13407.1 hypothetical protein EGT74_07745 [Chitinophaga lutea]
MEERNKNIEQWLREAAAKQEEEQSPFSEKQAGWAALRPRLDGPAAPRFPWMRWLGGAGVLLLGAAVCFMLILGKSDVTTEAVQMEDVGSAQPGNADGSDNTAEMRPVHEDNGPESGSRQGIQSGKKDGERKTGEVQSGNEDGSARDRNDNAGEAQSRNENESLRDGGKSTTGVPSPGIGDRRNNTGGTQPRDENNGSRDGNNIAGDVPRSAGGTRNIRNNSRQSANKTAHATGAMAPSIYSSHGVGAPGSRPENKPHPDGKDKSNAAQKTGTGKSVAPQLHRSITTAKATPAAATTQPGSVRGVEEQHLLLEPAPSIRHLPTKPNAALNASRIEIALRATPQKTPRYVPGGFSVKVAGIPPLDETYGFNIAAEYTFPLKNNIRLRPYLGAGYLTGFSRQYQHHAIYTRPIVGGPSSLFWVDSVGTKFNATALWFGEGGIQGVYALKRWELSAGIHYQYAWKITGKTDSTLATRPDSVHRQPYQTSLFSTGRLPGAGKLLLQAGVGFMIVPQLQGGLRYNLQLHGKKAGNGFTGDVPALPLQSSLEIQLRWYLRENKKTE